MSDESTQTNISSLENEGEELPPRQHPLPWILFGIAAVLLALVGGLLARRLSLETRRANEAIEKNAGLQAQMAQLQKLQAEVDSKVGAAEAKAKEAQDASIEAAAKLKAAEAERDKLVKELDAAKKAATVAAATPEPAKKTTAPAKKGKTTKKKKKRR